MYRLNVSLITIQYPKCIQRVSKWYRKTIQYRSPDGAKNVSCVYRASIEQKVSRYCIESRIDEITIHVRYTTIHYDTLRYIYGEKPPRYMGKMALSPVFPCGTCLLMRPSTWVPVKGMARVTRFQWRRREGRAEIQPRPACLANRPRGPWGACTGIFARTHIDVARLQHPPPHEARSYNSF